MASISCQIVETCIFKKFKNEINYLLLQRSPNDNLYPNLWQIITGTIERSETAKEAAIRELKEETSLSINKLWCVPYIDSFFDFKKDAVQLAVVFAAEASADTKIILSNEHQKYEWLNYTNARERLVWPGHKQILDIVNDFVKNEEQTSRLTEIILKGDMR